MARQEKLSRYRGLNPYVQKQKKENSTWYSVSSSFDDSKTQPFFITSSTEVINYPTTFNISSPYLLTEISTSLITYGRTVPENVNQYIQQQDTQLPKISPFVDIGDYANDGFIVAASASFFRTGSLVENAGFGFQQPLREKTKIEIDMSLSTGKILSTTKNKDEIFGYYNFKTKTLNAIGSNITPYALVSGSATISTYLFEKAIGFTPSFIDPLTKTRGKYGTIEIYKNQGVPTKTFGFPSNSRYKVSKDSGYTFSLSGSITEPFVLEKAVLHIGNLTLLIDGTNFNLTNYTSAVTNFFILNQRDNNLYKESFSFESAQEFSFNNYPTTEIQRNFSYDFAEKIETSKMDLITYAKIGTTYNLGLGDIINQTFDLYVTNSAGAPDLGYNISNVDINLNINQATKNSDTISLFPVVTDGLLLEFFKLKGLNGSRSGVDQISDRNWNRAIATDVSNKPLRYANESTIPNYETRVYYSDNISTIPYILLPTDNLVIGWQAPLLDEINFITDPNFISNGVNFWNSEAATSQLSFSGNFKLTLYGSYLRMNDNLDYEEYHEYDMNEKSLNNVSTVVIGEPIYKGDKL